MKTDINTIHLIIKGAVALALVCLAAAVGLALHGDKDVALVAIGPTTAVAGGLIGLLAKTSTGTGEAMTTNTDVNTVTASVTTTTPTVPTGEPAE